MKHLHLSRASLPHALRLAVILASAILGACHGSTTYHPAPPPPPPPPPPPVYSESEPNDHALHAPWFGWLSPGDLVYVEGFSADDGSDPQDGLAFTFNGPARIDFTLYVDDPWTDLDVWIFDPFFEQFVAAFTIPYGHEKGTFWLEDAQELHLVVVPSDGASFWTLAVESSSVYYAAALAPEGLPELPETLATYASPEPEEAERVPLR